MVSPAHRPPLPLPRATLPAPGRHHRDVIVNVRLLSAHPQPLTLSAAQGPALSARAPGPGVPVSPQQARAQIQCHQQYQSCCCVQSEIWKSLVNNISQIDLDNLLGEKT